MGIAVAYRTVRHHCRSSASLEGIMYKAFAVLIVAGSLAACGMISSLVDGIKLAKAVESDLKDMTGVKPEVGFNWSNGRLMTVTVTFPQLYESQPLHELAGTVRIAIAKEFKQAPENIVLAFALGKGNPPTTAQADIITPQQPALPDRQPRPSPRRT
jgi:hypothetical protein